MSLLPSTANAEGEGEPFRPEAGKFPPLEEALSYRGELVFVDHANRRGSIRVQGAGKYFRNAPHPFAMLPYGIVRYHGAPADLRDIPLGTVLHVRAFLPPDPKISAVPVLPVDNKKKNSGYSGAGIFPAENHVLLLEDEPSHCLREGNVWKLKEVDLQNNAGMIVASLEPKAGGDGKASEETMTFDAATRIWRGRECLGIEDLIAEGIWPASGKKSLDGQAVLLGITWKPTPGGVFTRFHISDIWLDDAAMQRAAQQPERNAQGLHPQPLDARLGRCRRVWQVRPREGDRDSVRRHGRLALRRFQEGVPALMNSVENTLKHTHGAYGPAHMACKGPILDVTKTDGEAPLGSSGIQIRFETDLIIEGIRPGRVVRVRPATGPRSTCRVRSISTMSDSLEDRFPTPAIFPKY